MFALVNKITSCLQFVITVLLATIHTVDVRPFRPLARTEGVLGEHFLIRRSLSVNLRARLKLRAYNKALVFR